MTDYNEELISWILWDETIRTFEHALGFIRGYTFRLEKEKDVLIGISEYKILPGFDMFLQEKYKLKAFRHYDRVFSDMKISQEAKYAELIASLKEYIVLPKILRDPLYDAIYRLRYQFGAFKVLSDIKKRLNLYFSAFTDGGEFICDTVFSEFNSFVLNRLSITDGGNWFDILSDRYGEENGLKEFFKLYDSFCDEKSRIV